MSYFDQGEDSILLLDESLLNLYDEQFKYSSFKSLISKKYNQSNEFMNQLFDSIEQDDDVNLVVNLSDDLKEKKNTNRDYLDLTKIRMAICMLNCAMRRIIMERS